MGRGGAFLPERGCSSARLGRAPSVACRLSGRRARQITRGDHPAPEAVHLPALFLTTNTLTALKFDAMGEDANLACPQNVGAVDQEGLNATLTPGTAAVRSGGEVFRRETDGDDAADGVFMDG